MFRESNAEEEFLRIYIKNSVKYYRKPQESDFTFLR